MSVVRTTHHHGSIDFYRACAHRLHQPTISPSPRRSNERLFATGDIISIDACAAKAASSQCTRAARTKPGPKIKINQRLCWRRGKSKPSDQAADTWNHPDRSKSARLHIHGWSRLERVIIILCQPRKQPASRPTRSYVRRYGIWDER